MIKMLKQLSTKISLAVPKHWLLLAAGITWSLVGAMLCRLAGGWLSTTSTLWFSLALAGGLLASIAIYRFGFVKIVHQNRRRIDSLKDKTCFFAFYPVKSYLLVIGMMFFGIFLRSTAIPKPYLAVVYLSVGAALFFSSLHYYRPAFLRMKNSSAESH